MNYKQNPIYNYFKGQDGYYFSGDKESEKVYPYPDGYYLSGGKGSSDPNKFVNPGEYSSYFKQYGGPTLPHRWWASGLPPAQQGTSAQGFGGGRLGSNVDWNYYSPSNYTPGSWREWLTPSGGSTQQQTAPQGTPPTGGGGNGTYTAGWSRSGATYSPDLYRMPPQGQPAAQPNPSAVPAPPRVRGPVLDLQRMDQKLPRTMLDPGVQPPGMVYQIDNVTEDEAMFAIKQANKKARQEKFGMTEGDWAQAASRIGLGLTDLAIGAFSKPKQVPHNPYLDQAMNATFSNRVSNQARQNQLTGNRLASLKTMSENFRSSNVLASNLQNLYSNYDNNASMTAMQEQQMRNQINTQNAGMYMTAGNSIAQAQAASLANEMERNRMIHGAIGDLGGVPALYGQMYNTNLMNKRYLDVLRETGVNFGPADWQQMISGKGSAITFNKGQQ